MKLTIENWSHKNIKEEIKDFPHIEKVELAVFCAEKVIGIFESKYPDDKRPRLAIEATKEFIKNPTDENKQRCKEAAYAANAAYAADVAAYAANAADVAAYAADVAAYAADYAAAAADYAAAAAKSNCLKQEIIDYIKELKGENMTGTTKKQSDKPVYTQEMADNGELPPVGISCMFKHQSEDNILFDDCFIVGYSKCGKFIIFHNHQNQLMQHNIVNGSYRFKPIDTRTDEEKLIDQIAKQLHQSYTNETDIVKDDIYFKSDAKWLLSKFDIKLK